MFHSKPEQKWVIAVGAALACTALLMLSGCGLLSGDDKDEQRKAVHLYSSAKQAVRQKRYQEAKEKLELLETNYPFSPYSHQAVLLLAYVNYKNHDYAATEVILDRFISLNPDSPNLDYAYYLKGMAHYNHDQGVINVVLKRDRTNKDPTPMINSFNTFKLLHEKYPDSRYAEDARLRTIALRNMLAVYEIRIADFYMQRRAYVAVVNRMEHLLRHYTGAQHTPEALVLLAEAYRRLRLTDLANDTLEVLKLNYPGYYRSRVLGNIEESDKESWLRNVKDLADSIGEILKLKSRY